MAEYIDRKDAIKAVEELQDCYNGFSDTYDKACIIGLLEELPNMNVEKIATEYCKKRNLVMITAESFEVLKAYYNRANGMDGDGNGKI